MQKIYNGFRNQRDQGSSSEMISYRLALDVAKRQEAVHGPTDEIIASVQQATDTYLAAKRGSAAQRQARIVKLTPDVAVGSDYLELMSVAHLLNVPQARLQFEKLCLARSNIETLYHSGSQGNADKTLIPFADVQKRAQYVRQLIRVQPVVFNESETHGWRYMGLAPSQSNVFRTLHRSYSGHFTAKRLGDETHQPDIYAPFVLAHKQQVDKCVAQLHKKCRTLLDYRDAHGVRELTQQCRENATTAMGRGEQRVVQVENIIAWQPNYERYGKYNRALPLFDQQSEGQMRMYSFLKYLRNTELPCEKSTLAPNRVYSSRYDYYQSIDGPWKSGWNVTPTTCLYAEATTRSYGAFFTGTIVPLADKIVEVFSAAHQNDYRRTLFAEEWASLKFVDESLLDRLNKYDNADFVEVCRFIAMAQTHVDKDDLEATHAALVSAHEARVRLPMGDISQMARLRAEKPALAWVKKAYARMRSNDPSVADYLQFRQQIMEAVAGPVSPQEPYSEERRLVLKLLLWGIGDENRRRVSQLDSAIDHVKQSSNRASYKELEAFIREARELHLPGTSHSSDDYLHPHRLIEDNIALEVLTNSDPLFPAAFRGAIAKTDVIRAWHFYNVFRQGPLRDVYTNWWRAIKKGDDAAALTALQSLLRGALRQQRRDENFDESVHGLTALRGFLQAQMQRTVSRGASSYGRLMSQRLKANWALTNASAVIQSLAYFKLLVAGDQNIADAWELKRYSDWHPDEACIRALESICKRDDIRAMRASQPGVEGLMQFLLGMHGPAGAYWHRDVLTTNFCRVEYSVHRARPYVTQAAHLAAKLPASAHGVEVKMADGAGVVLNGSDSAQMGAELARYSQQMMAGLMTLLSERPHKLCDTLLQMGATSRIESQMIVLQQALLQRQQAAA